MWTGISISIYTGLLVPIIFDSMELENLTYNEKFKNSMLAMVSLGVGEIFGGIGMGLIVDKVGSKRACVLNIANVTTACCVVILYIYVG